MRSNAHTAASSIWNRERCALAADALCQSGRLRMRVYGESMLPALWPGDVVEIASCSLPDVRTGEIVLALRDGCFFLHRLVAPGTAEGFRLCGDSMPGSDPPFPPEAMLGRLVRTSSRGKRVSANALGRGIGAKWSRALGVLFCHSSMARRLALQLHSRRELSACEFQNTERRPGGSPVEFGA
jgi:hypothetical protein